MYNIYVHSHERQMHNFVIEEPAGDSTGEMDQFGYFRCRGNCGKTFKTKQGRNRYVKLIKHTGFHKPLQVQATVG